MKDLKFIDYPVLAVRFKEANDYVSRLYRSSYLVYFC